eukprot:4827225-Pleurochrysis_carterae.AAC.2
MLIGASSGKRGVQAVANMAASSRVTQEGKKREGLGASVRHEEEGLETSRWLFAAQGHAHVALHTLSCAQRIARSRIALNAVDSFFGSNFGLLQNQSCICVDGGARRAHEEKVNPDGSAGEYARRRKCRTDCAWMKYKPLQGQAARSTQNDEIDRRADARAHQDVRVRAALARQLTNQEQ